MAVTGFSHAAIGVSDPDRSLAFYLDVLGLTVSMDVEQCEQVDEDHDGPPPVRRRAIYLRWNPQSIAGFIVLDYQVNAARYGKPLNMFDIGHHHISLSVDDIRGAHERAKAFGCQILGEPHEGVGVHWGMPGVTEVAVTTMILRDPDGTYVQVDEWTPERGR